MLGSREWFCNPSMLLSSPMLVVATISKTATVKAVLRVDLAFNQIPVFLFGAFPQSLVYG